MTPTGEGIVNALIAAADPAGGAAIDQVIIATTGATVATIALLTLAMGYRNGKDNVLARAGVISERVSGLPGWSALPNAICGVSLMVALLGMYWDIALHIGDGRDAGPLANPAHYLILFGLFGLFVAGVVGMVLPRGEKPGRAAVKIGKDWYAPVGAILMAACGAFALLGFPLDDMWHRLFGQDVTLWGPTHLMLIGGAGLSLVGQALLLAEGMAVRRERRGDFTPAPKRDDLPLITQFRRVGIMGGFLIGLSTFQAEFDFGVPQYRLVFQPLLIGLAAGVALVAARLWIGRGGAIAAAVFFLLVRGIVALFTGPVFGETTPSMPLYLGSALVVELIALRYVRRPMAFAALSGLAIGTVGFATEWGWSQVAMPLPWTGDILVEGLILSTVAALSGAFCGALLALGLDRRLDTIGAGILRAVPLVALIAVGASVVNGLMLSKPGDVRASVQMQSDGGATVRVDPAAITDDAAWVTVTAWQGGGLHVDRLERTGDGTFRTTKPIPVDGDWKAMLRVHDGRSLAAMPIRLPEDRAIPAPAINVEQQFTRPLGDEVQLMQRERKQDVAGWLWAAAGLTVLAIYVLFLAANAWAVGRFGRSARRRPEDREERFDRQAYRPAVRETAAT
jgi:hypothetical protein